jgi:hypothetical protein
MAQNPYLQNLLGINQGGMGLYNYNYSLPNYNTLLSQGLTEDQIKGYDTGFNTFNQFPYQAQPNPQLNYPQYGVVPQAPGVTPITTDTQTDTVSESITPGGVDYSSNVQDTVSTPYGDFTSDDFTQDIYTYPTGKPMNQMTEQELKAFGKDKGYIDKDSSRMMGPMQNTLEGKGLWGSMLSGPAQMLNDRQYNNYIDALSGRGMYSQGGPGEMSMMSFSPKYRETLELSKTLNDNNYYTKYNKVEGTSNIPGTFKKVSTLMNQFAPSGIGDNELVYHTSSGGHYQNDGKFVTGYGQVVASGSMQDAIDTIKAAAESGDTSTIPNKLNQEWYDKIVNAKANHLKPYQKDLKESWKKIKDTKQTKPKQKDTKKDYGPKSTAESTRAIKDKLESGKSVGGGDSVSRFKAQERTKKSTKSKAPPGRSPYGPHGL